MQFFQKMRFWRYFTFFSGFSRFHDFWIGSLWKFSFWLSIFLPFFESLFLCRKRKKWHFFDFSKNGKKVESQNFIFSGFFTILQFKINENCIFFIFPNVPRIPRKSELSKILGNPENVLFRVFPFFLCKNLRVTNTLAQIIV